MSSTGRVPLLDENDRFPDRFAPPSVAADAAVAEVARAGSVAAASGAEAARDESVAAAERAEAVPAQVDTAMADQVGTGGEFDTKLNATIGTVAIPRTLLGTQNGAAASALAQHMARLADARRRHGGVIGTGGKSVVAFQIAHQLDPFKNTIWPLFRERGIPVGWGAVTRAVGNPADPYEPTTATWDDVRQHFYEGAEVWSHSYTHLEPSPIGTGGTLQQEVSLSRSMIQSQNLWPQGFQLFGVPGIQASYVGDFMRYSQPFPDFAGWSSEFGQLMLSNYGLISLITAGESRALPLNSSYGLGYCTIDTWTLTQAKAQVDKLLDRPGLGTVLAFHPAYIGMGGRMSAADLALLLDYVKELWDNDEIEVLTQSGLAFADPGTARRFDLLLDNSFDGDSKSQTWSLPAGTSRLMNGSGRDGDNCLAIISDTGVAAQIVSDIRPWGANGMVFMFEGWIKNPNAAETGAKFSFVSTPLVGSPSTYLEKEVTLHANGDWTRFRFPVGIPQDCSTLRLNISRTKGNSVMLDDLHMLSA